MAATPYSIPGTRLFVGGLKYNVTKDQLQDFFSTAGKVQKVYLALDHDRPGGMNRGFGFVEMATPELAQTAIKTFDGKTGPGDRTIGVKLANESVR